MPQSCSTSPVAAELDALLASLAIDGVEVDAVTVPAECLAAAQGAGGGAVSVTVLAEPDWLWRFYWKGQLVARINPSSSVT
jgi:hypothetical protein